MVQDSRRFGTRGGGFHGPPPGLREGGVGGGRGGSWRHEPDFGPPLGRFGKQHGANQSGKGVGHMCTA